MPNYFLGIPFSDDVKDRLLAVQPDAIPGMRLIDRSDLHLTLHYLGGLSIETYDAVVSAMKLVTAQAFTIHVRGVGTFPPGQPPRVFWAGVEESEPLLSLHHRIGAALVESIAFQIEKRPYTPHITLARFNSPCPPRVIEDYVRQRADLQVTSAAVTRFVLYSSASTDGTTRYREEAEFELQV